jgi:hypothetical protein
MLWTINEFVFLVAIFAVFLLFMEIGFRTGRRGSGRHDEFSRSHIGSLQAAILGLLALLLGFTFAMAVSRYDARKSLVLDEANAIGTASLRARLLPSPQREEVGALVGKYVDARIDFLDAGIDPARLDAASSMSSQLQEQLWSQAGMAAERDPRSMPVSLFIQALNDVFDLAEKQRVALENHVPETVFHLLIVVSVIALVFIEYAWGIAGKRRQGSTAIFAFLIALVLATILDIDRPRRGLIQVGHESLLRLKADLDRTKP